MLAIKGKTTSKIVAVEKKFMSKRLDFNWKHYKTNIRILNELKITIIIEEINVRGQGEKFSS